MWLFVSFIEITMLLASKHTELYKIRVNKDLISSIYNHN